MLQLQHLCRLRLLQLQQCILCLQERTPLLPLPGGRCTHPVMCEGCSSVQTRKCNEDPEFAEQLQAMCPECCVAPA